MQDRAVLIVIVCCMGTVGRHRLTQPGHPSGLSKLSTSSSWAVNRPTLWHVKHYSRLWPCSVSLCVVECCENGDQHCSMDPYGSGRVFFHMTTSVVYMEDFALAVVSRTRRFQVGCAHLLHGLAAQYLSDYIPPVADSHRRRLWSSSFSHPTNTAVHCWGSCVSGG